MSDTVRTRDQLVAEFPDNDLGEIPAQASRDLVVSAFGFASVVDPTADWDNVDSAGVGAFFDFGSFVLNTVTQVEWRCYRGTPHTAIWQPAYNGASSLGAPLTLQPPTDGDFALALKQHSNTQSDPLLKTEDSSGHQFGPRITGSGDLSNPSTSTSTGSDNERFGEGALEALTSGSGNTALGKGTLQSLTSGSLNTAIGDLAANHLTLGSDNVAIGQNAMGNSVLGDRNVVIGVDAGIQLNGGVGNVAVGTGASAYLGSKNNNVSIGENSLRLGSAGDNNTAVGDSAAQGGAGTGCTFLGALTSQGSGTRTNSTVVGIGGTSTADHQLMMGTPAEQVYHPGLAFFATGPSGSMFVPASYAVLTGTTLSGLLPIGPITPSPGDRILTWDGVSATTWGVYAAASGAWSRVADMPAGSVYTGPAYVWVADEAFLLAGQGSLIALEPFSGPGIGNPPTWILGTDLPDWHYAVPTSKTVNGTFITVMTTVISHGLFEYQVNYTGPLSLDDWAVFGGDLDPTLIDWTTWPPAADVPASNVGPGYPYSDLSGAPASLNVYSQVTNPFSYGTGPTTVFTFTATNSIQGTISAENLSGSSAARLYVTTVDSRNGTQTNFIGIGAPGNWSGVIQIPEQLTTIGSTPGNITSITVQVSGNGSTGTAKVTGALTGL